MKVVAIETSTLRAEVALLEDCRLLASETLGVEVKHTAELVPALHRLLREAHWDPQAIQLVAVDVGPGSFTGLRIGLTCAKVLAYVAGCELVAVESTDCIAAAIPVEPEYQLSVALDAVRGEVFAARYHVEEGRWSRRELGILPAEAWTAQDPHRTLWTGPALQRYRHLLPPDARVLPESLRWPRAEWVGRVGWTRLQTQGPLDFWTLEPLYLRPSAAEERHPLNREPSSC
jgi:tRNA threonylcarbamoyladenosine biosynthesis protein TsaB